MYQDSASKHWYPAVIESLCSEPRSYKIITRDGIVYRKKTNLIWSLLHLRTRCLNFPSVCLPHWHNLTICGQWKLGPRRSHKWTIICKCRQADLKGTLSPLSSLIFKYFKVYLIPIWIYSVFILFTSMHKYPHNRVQDAKSYTCMCMHLNY